MPEEHEDSVRYREVPQIYFMFEKGDKYIHFTKYGGVNKGTVKHVHETLHIDLENGAVYKEYFLVSEKGFSLSLDGSDGRIYKIDRECSEEECKIGSINAKAFFDKVNKKKREAHERALQNMKRKQ